MQNEGYFKIISLIRDIKETDKILNLHKDNPNNIDTLMTHQFQHRKNYLLKELYIALIKSEFGIKNFQSILTKLSNYLQLQEAQSIISDELKENIAEIEKALEAV